MDVDIPQTQSDHLMETDPPIAEDSRPELTRKDSILDPDGDEVMQGDEEAEVYGDEDIEIGEGDGDDGENEGDYDVDLDATEGDQGIGETQNESLDTQGDTTGTGTTGEASSASVQDISASTSHPPGPLPSTETSAALDGKEKNAGAVERGTGPGPETDMNKQSQAEQNTEQALPVDNAVERANGDHHEEGAEHEEGDEHHDQGVEHEHEKEQEQDEEDEEEEEYDLLTPQTLPTIILNLPNNRISLFNPFSTEDGTEIPTWFGDRLQELCEAPLTSVWGAIRQKMEEESEGEGEGNDDEMVIIEKLMDLKMGDSDVNLEDVTFLELVQMYHDCQLPLPMELHLEFHPHRFITRFNAIQKELEAREVVYIEDDDEHGEGEDEEEEAEDATEAEGKQELEGHTDTHQLPVPLPPLEPGQNAEKSNTQANEPAAELAAEGDAGQAEIESTEVEAKVKEAVPLPPTADEIKLAKAGEPVDESIVNQAKKGQAETSDLATTDSAPTGQVSDSATNGDSKVVVPNTDPISQPAGVSEISPEITQVPDTASVQTTEEAEASTITSDDRVGTDLDTTEGQAQAQPIAGEAAVYEPAGDEDDGLIEGGEEYEEGDYDDEIGEGDAEGEGVNGAVDTEAEGLQAEVEGEGENVAPDAEGVEGGEVGEDVEGEDGDPYGVDGFVNGLDANADADAGVDAGDPGREGEVFEDEYEEYEDGYDPEAGAEGEVYEIQPEVEHTEVEADASVNPEDGDGGHEINADDELGVQRGEEEEEELVGDGEPDAVAAGGEPSGNLVEGAEEERGVEETNGEGKAGETSPSLIKRGRSADLEENEQEVAGKKVKIGEIE